MEPIGVSREKSIELRRVGGKYLADKQRLSVPMKYFNLGDNDSPLGVLSDFIVSLAPAEDDATTVVAPAKAATPTPKAAPRRKEGVGHNSFARKSISGSSYRSAGSSSAGASSSSSSSSSSRRTAADRRNMTTRTVHRRHNW